MRDDGTKLYVPIAPELEAAYVLGGMIAVRAILRTLPGIADFVYVSITVTTTLTVIGKCEVV